MKLRHSILGFCMLFCFGDGAFAQKAASCQDLQKVSEACGTDSSKDSKIDKFLSDQMDDNDRREYAESRATYESEQAAAEASQDINGKATHAANFYAANGRYAKVTSKFCGQTALKCSAACKGQGAEKCNTAKKASEQFAKFAEDRVKDEAEARAVATASAAK